MQVYESGLPHHLVRLRVEPTWQGRGRLAACGRPSWCRTVPSDSRSSRTSRSVRTLLHRTRRQWLRMPCAGRGRSSPSRRNLFSKPEFRPPRWPIADRLLGVVSAIFLGDDRETRRRASGQRGRQRRMNRNIDRHRALALFGHQMDDAVPDVLFAEPRDIAAPTMPSSNRSTASSGQNV